MVPIKCLRCGESAPSDTNTAVAQKETGEVPLLLSWSTSLRRSFVVLSSAPSTRHHPLQITIHYGPSLSRALWPLLLFSTSLPLATIVLVEHIEIPYTDYSDGRNMRCISRGGRTRSRLTVEVVRKSNPNSIRSQEESCSTIYLGGVVLFCFSVSANVRA